MLCERCGLESVVIDSRRPKKPGRVVRRRACACGARWSTVEKRTGPILAGEVPGWRSDVRPQRLPNTTTDGQATPQPVAHVQAGNGDENAQPVGVGGTIGGSASGVLFPIRSPDSQSNSAELVRKRRRRNDAPPAPAGPRFSDFWALYPRKVKKDDAVRAWNGKGAEAIADTVISALRLQLPGLAQRERKHVPHPATWLNARQWTDDPRDYGIDQPRANGALSHAERRSAANAAALASTRGMTE